MPAKYHVTMDKNPSATPTPVKKGNKADKASSISPDAEETPKKGKAKAKRKKTPAKKRKLDEEDEDEDQAVKAEAESDD